MARNPVLLYEFVVLLLGGHHSSFLQCCIYPIVVPHWLQIAPQKIVVPKANPLHAESYVQTNTIISMCPDFQIYDDKCPGLRLDVLRIKSDNNRRIIKGKGEERQADLLDNLRYLLNTFCKDIKI